MRKWILIGMLLVGLMVLLPSTVAADNGPHQGDFTSTTDACAGCHRAHRGNAENLLLETSQQALCYSCHGTSGAGADTNVQDGVYENSASGGAYGTVGAGLRGGGFTNAVMDPGMTGTPASASVTSNHSVGTAGTIWGNGTINATSDPGATGVTLECGSCHNPHGIKDTDHYRVLRPKPKNSDASSDVLVPDEATKNYTIAYASGYRDVGYLDGTMSEWCAQCHTRYMTDSFGDSGDAIFKYRHKTADNSRKCLACHVAHGTSATMGTNSGSVEWPDDTVGGGTNDSRLLHVNNRGICYQCHPSP